MGNQFMNPFLGQYIQYSQVYSDKPPSLEEVEEFFATLNTSHLIQLICKMNIGLWRMEGDYKKTAEIQDNLINLLFPDAEKKKLRDLLNSKIKKKVFTIPFHRHQLLMAIKLALKNVNLNGKTLEDKTDIGRYLLAISEHLQPNDFSLVDGIDILEMESIRREVSQLYYFSHSGKNVNEITRSLIIWLDIPNTQRFQNLLQADSVNLDIHSEFEQETGLTVREFVGLGFMYLGHISVFDVYTENPVDFMFTKDFWSKTNLSPIKVQKLELVLHQLVDDFQSNYDKSVQEKFRGKDVVKRNFLPLIEAPILKIGENFSVTADPQFLEERIASGVYWILLNKFMRGKDKKKQRALSKYFGLLHQEYVYYLLNTICDEVIEIPTIKDKKTCDFIGVFEKNGKKHLLFVEAKKIAPSLPTLLIGKEESVLRDLDKIFGETGFEQVYSTIQLFENGEIAEAMHIPVEEIGAIYPLLITDRFIVEEGLHRNLYEKKFLNQVVVKYPTVLKKTRPIFMSSQELEVIEAAKEDHYEFDFIDFLQHRENDLNNRFYRRQQGLPAGLTASDIGEIVKDLQPIWNDLYLAGFSKHINKRLKAVFFKYMKDLKKELFAKSTRRQ